MLHRVDLAEPDALAPMIRSARPTTVFHAAARGGHPSTGPARVAAWRDTVTATVALVEALDGAGTERLMHFGSSLEYRPSDGPLCEAGPLEPVTARGAAKLAATVAVRQRAAEIGLPATVLRPFSVYGPGEQPGRLIPTVLRSLRTGAPFCLEGGTSRRDFIHVDDVVDACLRAAANPSAAGEVLNVGTGIETSTREVAELAQAVTGRRLVLAAEPFPPRPGDTPHWVADMKKTQAVLGWRHSIDLREGLRLTLAADARS